jgi:hypothetical protein
LHGKTLITVIVINIDNIRAYYTTLGPDRQAPSADLAAQLLRTIRPA